MDWSNAHLQVGNVIFLHVFVCISVQSTILTFAGFISRALDPMILPSKESQVVVQRLLTFIQSLSTVLASAYCLSRWMWEELFNKFVKNLIIMLFILLRQQIFLERIRSYQGIVTHKKKLSRTCCSWKIVCVINRILKSSNWLVHPNVSTSMFLLKELSTFIFS